MTQYRNSVLHRLQRAGRVAVVVLPLASAALYSSQPDILAAATLLPPWLWIVPTLALAIIVGRDGSRLWFLLASACCVGYVVAFVEEPRSLILGFVDGQSTFDEVKSENRLRIVSLNCAGSSGSVLETAKYRPEIVLLQEAPGSSELNRLAREVVGPDGSVFTNGDLAILVRGHFTLSDSSPERDSIAGILSSPGFPPIGVVNLRLSPPVSRFDFWSKSFWIEHRDNRIQHRKQLLDVVCNSPVELESGELIVGGDFNMPPHDRARSVLNAHLKDAFHEAGRGWGHTGTNEYPLFRVDQILIGDRFKAVLAAAFPTSHSDHRIVVCELTTDVVP